MQRSKCEHKAFQVLVGAGMEFQHHGFGRAEHVGHGGIVQAFDIPKHQHLVQLGRETCNGVVQRRHILVPVGYQTWLGNVAHDGHKPCARLRIAQALKVTQRANNRLLHRVFGRELVLQKPARQDLPGV